MWLPPAVTVRAAAGIGVQRCAGGVPRGENVGIFGQESLGFSPMVGKTMTFSQPFFFLFEQNRLLVGFNELVKTHIAWDRIPPSIFHGHRDVTSWTYDSGVRALDPP